MKRERDEACAQQSQSEVQTSAAISSSEPPAKRVKTDIQLDHQYAITASPRKLRKQLLAYRARNITVRHNLKINQQRARRYKKKVTSLKTVVESLRKKGLITVNCEEILNQTKTVFWCITGINDTIANRQNW